ncbi:MAG: hypothetical protein HOY78_15525 [Saccharothrix sp.]|nr:hypothetical protein [Saccharothrix sp.]
MEATRTLRLIGYWHGPEAPGWPDVRSFVDDSLDPAARDRVSTYLRSGTVLAAAAGWSSCRLCGRPNGSTELTDGVRFVWPEGLPHYVEAHNVRLPAEVTAAMDVIPPAPDVADLERRLFVSRELTVDTEWWRDRGR